MSWRKSTERCPVVRQMGLSQEKVILSLENKEKADYFPEWEILQEPVADIHSLMFYSRLLISNGDSMAREGAQMGIPSWYCGTRDMPANRFLLDMGYMNHSTDPKLILQNVRKLDAAGQAERQEKRRAYLLKHWDDPIELLYQNLHELTQNSCRQRNS